MASLRKSYFLVPSWDINPKAVALGSVVANPTMPQRTLSTKALATHIDTPVYKLPPETDCSGTAKKETKWSAGLFANFIHFITLGGEASVLSESVVQIDYSCGSMETHRFAPSPAYITTAAEDRPVKDFLKMGGLGAKVFVITGVKIASDITITTVEEKKKGRTAQLGVEISPAQVKVGPKATYDSANYTKHTRKIAGPIVFAFELEKVRVNTRRKIVHGDFIEGAMLGKNGRTSPDYVIERAGQGIDEEDVCYLDVSVRLGKDEAGRACEVIVP